MSIEIFENLDQGSYDWFRVRAGIPTASMFQAVMSKGRSAGAESKTRRTYMLRLLGERLTGEVAETFSNVHMERGKEMEADARRLYEFREDVQVMRVGFIRNGLRGCSPDSLRDANGIIEIKTKLPHIHLDVMLADELPSEHKAQCQGQLLVAEREYLDFVSYWPGLPLFVKRVYRDDEYLKALDQKLTEFTDEMFELEAEMRSRMPKAA